MFALMRRRGFLMHKLLFPKRAKTVTAKAIISDKHRAFPHS